MKKIIKYVYVLTIGFLVLGCGDTTEPPNPSPTLTEIRIETSDSDVLIVSQTAQLTVAGFDQNGAPISINSSVTWTANSDGVVVDGDGTVEAVSAGVSVVTATTQDLTATFEITVQPLVVTRLEISSPVARVDLAETVQLSAMAFDQLDNQMTDFDVTWSVDNSNVTVDQDGNVTGQAVGSSVITGEADGTQSTIDMTVWDSSAPRTEIYVSDVGANRNGPHQILRYDEDGSFGSAFISTNLNRPQDIVFLEDEGIAIVSSLGTNVITSHDINSGAFLGNFATGLNGPTRVEIGPDSLIYVLQWNGGSVRRYEFDGTFVDDFTDTGVIQAIGITWDSAGNLYVAAFNNGANGYVQMYDTNGVDQGAFINSNLTGPTDIWFDDAGNMLVNDWSGNVIRQFDSTGAFIGNFATGLSQPEGVDFLDGNVLIGNSGTGSVKMYDASGSFVMDVVAPGAAALVTPNAVTVRHVNQ